MGEIIKNDGLIHIAESFARENTNGKIEPAHFLKALMHNKFGLRSILKSLNHDVYYIEEWADIRIENYKKTVSNNESLELSDTAKLILKEAKEIQNKYNTSEYESILISLSTPGIGFTYDELKSFILKPDDLIKDFADKKSVILDADKNNGNSNLEIDYCINLNLLYKKENGHSIIGKEKEIQIIKETLIRWIRPNILIVGDSGVGKSSIVELFVKKLNDNLVPENLKNSIVYELDMSLLKSQVKYNGELEDRINSVINKMGSVDNPILFIDNIHGLFDKSGDLYEVGSIIKYNMSKGRISLIGISSIEGFTKFIEPDSNLNDSFEKIIIEEPSDDISEKILMAIKSKLEKHHNLKINETVLPRTIDISKRYFTSTRLPQSSITLLDQSMAAVRSMLDTSYDETNRLKLEYIKNTGDEKSYEEFYQKIVKKIHPLLLLKLEEGVKDNLDSWEKKCANFLEKSNKLFADNEYIVDELELNYSVSQRTSIPMGKINKSERERLINMKPELQKRVVGQDFAIESIVEAVHESRAGLTKSNQPIGSFFFLGPTGTGKTELAKALAEFLFDDEQSLIRFDMSEFKEEHSAALLYGAPPGYVGYEEGGMLVNKIRQRPYSILLFDEIEKAHPSVYDIFLQILDEGVLHDRLGKKGDFTNAVILFTSNIGSEYIVERIKAGEVPSSSDLMEVMSAYFRPEFLARLTSIIPFSPISENVVVKIFNIHLQKLIDITKKMGISLEVEKPAIEKLAISGFSPKYGARPLIGVIRNEIRKPLSKMIVANEVFKGSKVTCKLDDTNDIKWIVEN